MNEQATMRKKVNEVAVARAIDPELWDNEQYPAAWESTPASRAWGKKAEESIDRARVAIDVIIQAILKEGEG